MLYWSLIFFVVSVFAGLLGMNGVAGATMDIAQFLFWGFMILAAVFLILGVAGARKAKRMLS
ncbi:MAG: DUF1328 domain-containing protein [Bdellovibrionota bacterium]